MLNRLRLKGLLICVAEEEELRTSFLEDEDEERDRGTLEDLGGGRMEQCEALDRFNLEEDETDLGGRFPFSALSLSP